MASANAIVIISTLLALQLMAATSNFFSPLLPPVSDTICQEVDCGNGKCKPDKSSTFSYECECDLGWKQTPSDLDEYPKFLPCIIPNCTINHACTGAPSPLQEKPIKANDSIFDPCHWTDCGGGSCKKTSMFTYNCECAEGYYNLLNDSTFPCYEECAIGMDCPDLGIPMANKPSSPPTPALPDNNDVCQKVECGKGKCKPNTNSTIPYECECDLGWKQTRSDDDDNLKFLPCIVPNCTMNYACQEAPSPVQDKSVKDNGSIFNPCHWTDCGGGSCNKTSPFTYSCECAAGYYNLLNVSAFPCFKECAIGMDCANLGISMTNTSASPPSPALADNTGSNLVGNYHWLMVLILSLAMM